MPGSREQWAVGKLTCAGLALALPLLVAGGGCGCLKEPVVEAPPTGLDALPLAVRLIFIVILVSFSGLFSGLTLGLMGLDVIGLQMIENGDNAELSKCAAKIKPVRQSGNQLLCTLLLGNVAVNSAMAILANKIFTGLAGFLISTGLIVVFGEIIPQATCAQYALQIGSKTVCIVRVLMLMFYPICKPMAMILDLVLGKDIGQIYSTSELMEMVKLQIDLGAQDSETGVMAKQIVEGALAFREKKARDVMTLVDDLYMLSEDVPLGYAQVRDIFENGHSRIPVFGAGGKCDIKGLLFAKDLMLADPEDEMRLGDFINIFNRETLSFKPDTMLYSMLSSFKAGKAHMSLVWEMDMNAGDSPRSQLLGAVTLEDIMEEILAEEIVDETDQFKDVHKRDRVDSEACHINPHTLKLGSISSCWLSQGSSILNPDEVTAIASHLQRVVFREGSELELQERTIKWLISVSEVRNRARTTPPGINEADPEDTIYTMGTPADFCLLVLQGKIAMRVGREQHPSEAGSFRVLAQKVLTQAGFVSDFDAHVGSAKVRYLVITQDKFNEAQAKDKDSSALDRAERERAVQAAAENSRKEARSGQVPKQAKQAGKRAKVLKSAPDLSPE